MVNNYQSNGDTPDVIRKELEPHEVLLWSDQPSPIRLALTGGQYLLLGLFFCVMTGLLLLNLPSSAHRVKGSETILFGQFGVIFILGLSSMLYPVWLFISAPNTFYAMTDRRILIVNSGMSRKISSYSKSDLGSISRTERAGGSGDLTFAQEPYSNGRGMRRITFVGIQRVRDVEMLLRKTFGIE